MTDPTPHTTYPVKPQGMYSGPFHDGDDEVSIIVGQPSQRSRAVQIRNMILTPNPHTEDKHVLAVVFEPVSTDRRRLKQSDGLSWIALSSYDTRLLHQYLIEHQEVLP